MDFKEHVDNLSTVFDQFNLRPYLNAMDEDQKPIFFQYLIDLNLDNENIQQKNEEEKKEIEKKILFYLEDEFGLTDEVVPNLS